MRILHSNLNRLFIAPIVLTLAFGVSAINAEPTDWKIDSEHFSITFEAEHIGFQNQIGMFLEASGNFNYDPVTLLLSSGRVVVQAASIFSNNQARDEHLSGRDFLNANRNPLIVFEATQFEPNEQGDGIQRGSLTGNLTLLGETHPVVLDVVINKQDKYPFGHRKETLGISARATILRSLWGMDYGVGNNMVGDEVTLRFEFEALSQ
jgi:polyisoprenoid-binding protein YceI